jgi:hypothetical protein
VIDKSELRLSIGVGEDIEIDRDEIKFGDENELNVSTRLCS